MKQQKKPVRKPSRHHWFLISIFVVIILLGLTAFILQRSTNIEAIAGEAIRQRIAETKQLALSEEEVRVARAIELGEKNFGENCPFTLKSGAEQHWALEGNWKFKELQVVEVECKDDMISCYYAISGSEINRADQVGIYNIIPNVKNCKEKSGSTPGCSCEIASLRSSGAPPTQ